MSERASKYRAARRRELLAELNGCEALLATVEKAFVAEYRKAFAALQRAGARYDKTRRDGEVEWDQLSLDGLDAEALQEQIEQAFGNARENIEGIRAEFEA